MPNVALWRARRDAEDALRRELSPYKELVEASFLLLDRLARSLESLPSASGVACALVVGKARNLALGCYSLSLDGLSQEAGALLLVLIECQEVLTYIRIDPSRVTELLEDRLPSAGKIAQRIDGSLKPVRNYLNTHASHFSSAPEALAHLVNAKSKSVRLAQRHSTAVLTRNLDTLLVALIWTAIEAANCLGVLGGGDENAMDAMMLKKRFMELVSRPDVGDTSESLST